MSIKTNAIISLVMLLGAHIAYALNLRGSPIPCSSEVHDVKLQQKSQTPTSDGEDMKASESEMQNFKLQQLISQLEALPTHMKKIPLKYQHMEPKKKGLRAALHKNPRCDVDDIAEAFAEFHHLHRYLQPLAVLKAFQSKVPKLEELESKAPSLDEISKEPFQNSFIKFERDEVYPIIKEAFKTFKNIENNHSHWQKFAKVLSASLMVCYIDNLSWKHLRNTLKDLGPDSDFADNVQNKLERMRAGQYPWDL